MHPVHPGHPASDALDIQVLTDLVPIFLVAIGIRMARDSYPGHPVHPGHPASDAIDADGPVAELFRAARRFGQKLILLKKT